MRSLCGFLLACAAFAQGTDPKPKAEDYPVQAEAKILGQPVAVGAEFMVHSFSKGEEAYVAPEFIVVEVALYPPKGAKLTVSPSQFSLRINGKKQALLPQSPGLVASSFDHPEWQNRPRFEMGGGMGGIGVGTPQPQPTGIPGRDPSQQDPYGSENRPRVNPRELAVQTALPMGEFQKPVSGFLYFSYKGKGSSIKSLELTYDDTVIKLR